MHVHRLIGRLIFVGAMITPVFSCVAQQFSVQQGTLLSRESVRINVTTTVPFALGRESVSMANNRLTVTMRSYDNIPEPGPAPSSDDVAATSGDVILGKLPQGNYSIEVLFLNRRTSIFTSIGTTQFTVGEDFAALLSGYPAYDFTDLWWNPNESGWGMSIHVKRNVFFAAWFVYDSVGKPTWYTLQLGRWEAPNTYSGLIFATRAAPNSGVGPMASLAVTQVGSGTLTFNASDQAVFSYVVDGVKNSKNIVREVF